MPKVSIEAFRASRQFLQIQGTDFSETLWVYWQDKPIDPRTVNLDEILHIFQQADGGHHLQIANLVHEGTQSELEEILYEWALEEGHLEGKPNSV